MQTIILHPKFNPSILNFAEAGNREKTELKDRLDGIFNAHKEGFSLLSEENGFLPVRVQKKHCVRHPNLPGKIIHGAKENQDIADQHVYQVRKAIKIQQLIQRLGFTEIVVPQKLLYEYQGQWFVISEELDIDHQATLSDVPSGRTISSKQAHELATICFAANLATRGKLKIHFTKEGKIALINTEPSYRGYIKSLKTLENSLSFWVKDEKSSETIALRIQRKLEKSINFLEKLVILCTDSKSVEEIEKIYKNVCFNYWVQKIKIVAALSLAALILPLLCESVVNRSVPSLSNLARLSGISAGIFFLGSVMELKSFGIKHIYRPSLKNRPNIIEEISVKPIRKKSLTTTLLDKGARSKWLISEEKVKISDFLEKSSKFAARFVFCLASTTIIPCIGVVYHLAMSIKEWGRSLRLDEAMAGELRQRAWQHLNCASVETLIGIPFLLSIVGAMIFSVSQRKIFPWENESFQHTSLGALVPLYLSFRFAVDPTRYLIEEKN